MSEVCLLPGPVAMSSAVRAALKRPPLYHRGTEFLAMFEQVRSQLAAMTRTREVALFAGSGTLANDVVAATLAASASAAHGLILENGEFGQRLIAQARRFGLRPRVLSWPWGAPWDLNAVADALDQMPRGSWVWGAHLETSTGVLNDLAELVRVARLRDTRVCVDAVSSLGGVPADLSDAFLASGTSGKGLGAACGIAIVFANRTEADQWDNARVPTYLDLDSALDQSGPRFTFSSTLVEGLATALSDYATPEGARRRYAHFAALGLMVRSESRRLGYAPLADEAHAASTVTTFAPPPGWTSEALVDFCRDKGVLIGGQSQYLAKRRLVQIATMGAVSHADCAALFQCLRDCDMRSSECGQP